MRLKAVSVIMLTLLSISMLTLAFNIQPVKASETINIRADGSINPPTAPITSDDNSTYTLTADINSTYIGIEVRRSNITIDGNGYSLQGTTAYAWHMGSGIYLVGSNVTVKHIQIRAFHVGIEVYGSLSSINANNFVNNSLGISLSSDYNSVFGNNLTSGTGGIVIHDFGSDNNRIYENNITNNDFSIVAEGLNNRIYENNLENNSDFGIRFFGSGNYVYHNNFMNNAEQVVQRGYSSENYWDNGYPSGGNYWGDYTGVDSYSGPYQNETGSDGIGDTPYVIDEDNQDNYPLMYPWGAPPPAEEGEEVPFWMQWWFYAIVAAGIVALVGVVYFLKKRKQPTAPSLSTEQGEPFK